MKQAQEMLVRVDDLRTLGLVLGDIVRLADEAKNRVTFVGVVEPLSWWARANGELSIEDCTSAQVAKLEKHIEAAVTPLSAKRFDVEIKVLAGDHTKTLMKAVSQEGYDILVKAPQGPLGGLLASINQRPLRYAPYSGTNREPEGGSSYTGQRGPRRCGRVFHGQSGRIGGQRGRLFHPDGGAVPMRTADSRVKQRAISANGTRNQTAPDRDKRTVSFL